MFVFIDIEVDFKEQLQTLVPQLLAKENLIMKEINGSRITCRDLVEYFKVFSCLNCYFQDWLKIY
jgi:atlastin